MIKLTGCVLLFVSCSALGFLKSSSFKARSRELENILELIRLLRVEISYKKEPLARTFRNVSLSKPCWFSDMLLACSEALDRHSALQNAWKTALDQQGAESPLETQDLEILRDMALGLGKSDIEGQNRILEPVELRIADRLQKAKQQEERQGRMYKGLGISAGIIIVILII